MQNVMASKQVRVDNVGFFNFGAETIILFI